MKDAIIRAEALRFSYTSAEGVAPVVLDGVDLSIQEGTFVAVLGHNGSGKSTLLEAIAVAKGIDLSKVDASSRHGSLVPPATRYSTLQDLDAGRHTEIDMFSGALMRMGQELGIPTPYNEYTYHIIKALEEKNDGLFDYVAKASDLTCAK